MSLSCQVMAEIPLSLYKAQTVLILYERKVTASSVLEKVCLELDMAELQEEHKGKKRDKQFPS